MQKEVVKMKKVKVIKKYNDVMLNKIQEVDTVIETEDDRAEHLVKENVAEYIVEKKSAEKKG